MQNLEIPNMMNRTDIAPTHLCFTREFLTSLKNSITTDGTGLSGSVLQAFLLIVLIKKS